MQKIIRLFLVAVLITTPSYASSLLTDEQFEDIRQHVKTIYAQSPSLAIDEIDKLLSQYQTQLQISQQLKLLYGKAWYQILTGNISTAIRTLTKCKQLNDTIDAPDLTFHYYSLMASAFYNLAMHDLALENYLSSYEIAQQINDQDKLHQTENNIGTILMELNRFDEAKNYFQRFYDSGITQNAPSIIATALNNLGEVAIEQGNIEQAIKIHHQALAIREQHNYLFHSSWSHFNLGKSFIKLEQYPKAIEHLHKAIEIRQNSKSYHQTIEPMLSLVTVYLATQQEDSADTLLNEAIVLAKQHNNIKLLANAYLLQKQLYQQINNLAKALTALELYTATYNEHLTQKADASLAYYLAKADVATKEIDIINLKKDNLIKQTEAHLAQFQLWVIIISSLIIALILAYFIHRIREKNITLNNTISQLKATQHALVEAEKMSAMTTLVSGMAHQLNTPLGIIVTSTSLLQDRFSYIKKLLNDKKLTATKLNDFIHSTDEILDLTENNIARTADMIQRFKTMAIQLESAEIQSLDIIKHLQAVFSQIRASAKTPFNYKINGISTMISNYPNMLAGIFQQLIDNSCIHGFKNGATAFIEVDCHCDNNNLIINYRDNGKGVSDKDLGQLFDPFFTTNSMQQSMGLGLNIVYNAVVHLMAGTITCHHNNPGLSVVISFPLKVEPLTKAEDGNLN